MPASIIIKSGKTTQCSAHSKRICTHKDMRALLYEAHVAVAAVACVAAANAAVAAAAVALPPTVCCWHCCCGRIESVRQIGNNNAHVSKIEFKYTYDQGRLKEFDKVIDNTKKKNILENICHC